MARMTAGRLVIESLLAENCNHTFGLVGTTTNSIVTEMHGRSDIRFRPEADIRIVTVRPVLTLNGRSAESIRVKVIGSVLRTLWLLSAFSSSHNWFIGIRSSN